MIRTSFTRYRAGSASTLAITPAWLNVTAGTPRGDVRAPVVAWIRVKKTWDVLMGDILKGSDGRLFVVRQIAPEQQTKLLACGELDSIIPDEFESSTLDQWWTILSGYWGANFGTSLMAITPPLITPHASIRPDLGAWVYQTAKSDFDVYARINTPIGLGAPGDVIHYGLLGARLGGLVNKGCYIGAVGDGLLHAVRVDQTDGINGETRISGVAHWVRLKRLGTMFTTYYCLLPAGPENDDDWIILQPTHSPAVGTDDVQIGLCAFCGLGTPIITTFDLIRNM